MLSFFVGVVGWITYAITKDPYLLGYFAVISLATGVEAHNK